MACYLLSPFAWFKGNYQYSSMTEANNFSPFIVAFFDHTLIQEISQRVCIFEHCVKIKSTVKNSSEGILLVYSGPGTLANRSAILTLILLCEHRRISQGNIRVIFPSFSWGIFSHAARLNQSCASENI